MDRTAHDAADFDGHHGADAWLDRLGLAGWTLVTRARDDMIRGAVVLSDPGCARVRIG
jgi:hypothetical protein